MLDDMLVKEPMTKRRGSAADRFGQGDIFELHVRQY